MSELSSLSHEYATRALFAEEFNAAMLTLKKARFQTPGLAALSPEDVEEARQTVAQALAALLAALDPAATSPAAPESATRFVPEEVVERVQKGYGFPFPYLSENLKKGIEALHSGQELEDDIFAMVDQLCDLADATASTAFRRLWIR